MMSNFLNNLWVAISTPNEELIKMLSIPLLIFVEIPLTLYLIKAIFNVTTNKKQNLIYIFITSLETILSGFFIPNPYNVILNYVTAFIILHYVFKTNILKTILAGLLPSFTFAIVQSLLLNPYITILNVTYDQAINTAIYRVPFAIFVSFNFYCIIHNKT